MNQSKDRNCSRLIFEPGAIRAIFDPKEHIYSDETGKRYISVTQAMKFFTDETYRFIPREILKRAAMLGTAVHLATEFLDKGSLDWNSLISEWIPYLDAYQKFKKEFSPELLAIEKKMIHSVRQFAGTVDRVMFWKGSYWVVDLKTTNELYEYVGIQLAGYEELLKNNLVDPPKFRRAALQLKDDGTYLFHEFNKPDDHLAFLSLLNLNKWKKNHGNKTITG